MSYHDELMELVSSVTNQLRLFRLLDKVRFRKLIKKDFHGLSEEESKVILDEFKALLGL